MTSAGRAFRGMTREPLRAALAVAGLAAVGALLFDMLLLSRGLVVSFRDLLDSVGFDVRATASEALPTLGPAISAATDAAARIRALPEVKEVIAVRVGRASVLDGTSEATVNLMGTGARNRSWTLLRGAGLPDEPALDGVAPVVVSEALAKALKLEPGSLLPLRGTFGSGDVSVLPSVQTRVTGVGRSAFDAPGEFSVLTTLTGYAAITGETNADEADLLLIASRDGASADAVVAAIRKACPELYPFSNEQFLTRFDQSDFSYFRQISFVLSSITLFFAFLLVATLLTVSVNQRLGEVAALRAIGFSRGRVVVDLLWESAFLVGIGGTLSIPLGAALALWLDGILKNIPGLPERLHFFVFEPRALLLHAGLMGVTAVVAAVYPIWLAATLPIAATLRKEIVS